MSANLKRRPMEFTWNLTWNLEVNSHPLALRILDLIAPLGMGQCGLIVGEAGSGKTRLIHDLLGVMIATDPSAHFFVLLCGEFPENVSAYDKLVGLHVEIVTIPFDATPAEQIRKSTDLLDRAKQVVEQGRHAVLAIDPLHTLVEALIHASPATGRLGEPSRGWKQTRDFLGAAGAFDNHCSLTILATLRIDSESHLGRRMHDEFASTCNWQVWLDRQLADQGIWPAIDVNRSGCRSLEHFFRPDQWARGTP